MTESGLHEFCVSLPVSFRDRVVQWFLDRGTGGVQEDWPGLGDPGPVISGDPAEWSGEALVAPSGTVVLRAWLPAEEEPALRAILPDGAGLTVCLSEQADWASAWREAWVPIEVGQRLVICAPWAVPERTARIPVIIEPGQASGTGVHFTTRACLELIEEAVRPGDRVLDVGTGSGILAIAAVRLGAKEAVGIDTDPVSLPEAGANAVANQVTDRIRFLQGDPTANLGRFDGVIANLTGSVIVRHAGALAAATRPGGIAIVSGILEAEAGIVEAALAGAGFTVERRLTGEGWVAMRLGRG
jgi:ribosomal protein L11 methyltransferase